MACRFPFIKIEEKIPGTFLRENVYIPYILFRALTARLYFCHFALLTKLLVDNILKTNFLVHTTK